jgi:hypothetical protein
MRAAWLAAWCVSISACAAAIGLASADVLGARRAVTKAQSSFQLASEQAHEIAQLRTDRPSVPPLPKGGPAISTRVSSVLSACGLPASVLANISPEADTTLSVPDSRDRYVRRRVTLNLTQVTLPKLGAFLEAWRRAEPHWTPAALEVVPTQPKDGFLGGDLPLNITIVLEGLFVDETGGGR